MKNFKLIYNHVKEVKMKVYKKDIQIKLPKNEFDSSSLVYLASRLKGLNKYYMLSLNIIIELGDVKFKDKITYMILDSMIYYTLKNTRFNMKMHMHYESNKPIHNGGFIGTAVYNSLDLLGWINRRKFIDFYEREAYVTSSIYRKYLTSESLKDSSKPSKICTDVAIILKSCCDDEEWVDNISEAISELLCNVASHTDGDCLIHIDNSEIFEQYDESRKPFLFINIAVMNFSENRLFDVIQKNIIENKYDNEDKLYNRIYKAYEKHKDFFNETYNKEDFFLVTAFQNHVTSRSFKSGNSGTGLTSLIEKIIGIAYRDFSYVLSGNNIIFFKNDYLKLSQDKFIGFNKENDYFNFRPSEKVINKSNLYIPGSVYNLSLVKEIEDGNKN